MLSATVGSLSLLLLVILEITIGSLFLAASSLSSKKTISFGISIPATVLSGTAAVYLVDSKKVYGSVALADSLSTDLDNIAKLMISNDLSISVLYAVKVVEVLMVSNKELRTLTYSLTSLTYILAPLMIPKAYLIRVASMIPFIAMGVYKNLSKRAIALLLVSKKSPSFLSSK